MRIPPRVEIVANRMIVEVNSPYGLLTQRRRAALAWNKLAQNLYLPRASRIPEKRKQRCLRCSQVHSLNRKLYYP